MGLLDDAIREHLDLKRRRGADPTEVERQEREVLGPVRPRGERDLADPPGAHEDDLEHEPLPYDDEPWDDDAAPGEPPQAPSGFDYDGEEGFEDVAPSPPESHRGYYPSEPEAPHAADPYGADSGFAAGENAHGYADEAGHRYADEAGHRYAEEPGQRYADGPGQRYADEPAAPPGGYRGATEGDPFPAHYVPEPHAARPNTDEPTAEFSLEELHAAEHDPSAGDEEHRGHASSSEDVLQETPDFLQDTPDHDRLWFEQRPPRDFDFDG